MAKYSNSIEYNIKTSADLKGFTQLQAEIGKLETKLTELSRKDIIDSDKMVEGQNNLKSLSKALSDAFNPQLGVLDLSTFNKSLSDSGVTANSLRSTFNKLGADGSQAYANLLKQVNNFSSGITKTQTGLQKLQTTFANTFRWGLISSFFSQTMGALNDVRTYMTELDDSLTQIMLVTDYNRDSMREYAAAANEAAKALSNTTVGVTNASLVFAQQGYDLNQSQQLAELSIKLANASQQDSATTSDQITAYMNAYGLQDNIQELSQALDSWALIANVSAADVKELAEASQRAASTANTVGVNMDQLGAQIATIESVTREGASQIGNALRTMYSRFTDLELGETLEDGVDLGDVTGTLQKIGVQVLDEFGQMRDVGSIFEDLMGVWQNLDRTTQEAVSSTLVGRYQVNRFNALMNNADMYEQYKEASQNANGTLDQMQEEFNNSLEGKMNKLQATFEGLISSIFSPDNFYPAVDALTDFVNLLQGLVDSIGGAGPVIGMMTSAFIGLSKQSIATFVGNSVVKSQQRAINENNAAMVKPTLQLLGEDVNSGIGQAMTAYSDALKEGIISPGQADEMRGYIDSLIDARAEMERTAEAADTAAEQLNILAGALLDIDDAATDYNFYDLDSEDAKAGWDPYNFVTQLREFGPGNEEVFKAVKENFSNLNVDEITDMAAGLSLVQDELQKFQKGAAPVDATKKAISELGSEILELAQSNHVGDIVTEQLQEAFDGLTNSADLSEDEIQQFTEIIERFYKSTANVASNLQNFTPDEIAKQLVKAGEEVQAAQSRKELGKNAYDNEALRIQEILGTIDTQTVVNGLLDVAQASLQVVSGFQAITNLGNIWTNENLSGGEKLVQTFTAVASASTMLLSAFSMIGKVIPKLAAGQKTLQAAAADLAATQVANTAATAAETTAEGTNLGAKLANAVATKLSAAAHALLTKAVSLAAAAVGTLSKALAFMTGPIGLAITAGAALVGVLHNIAEGARANALEDAKEKFSEASTALDEFNTKAGQVDNFKTLYESWQNGETTSNELKEECLKLADALDDAGLKARANAGEFDAFAKAVEESTRKAGDAARKELIASSQAVTNAGNDQGWFGLGGVDAAITDARARSITALSKVGMADLLEGVNSMDAGSVERVLATLKAARSEVEQDTPEWQALSDAMQEFTNVQQNFPEEVQAAIAMRNAQAEMNDFQDKLKEVEAETGQLYQAFAQSPDFGSWFQGLSYLDQLSFMLEHTKDEAQQANLSLAQTFAQFTGGDQFKTEQIGSTLTQWGMSLEDGFKLAATIDEDATYEDIVRILSEIGGKLRDGTTLDEALQDLFKDSIEEGIDEADVEKALDAMKPSDADVKEDDFRSLNNTFLENTDKFGVEDTPFADYSPELAKNAEGLAEVTEGILRYNDAVQSIDKNLEDWKTALNETNEFSLEHIRAVEELQDTYSDFLNLAEGTTVSKEFAENAENLELMERAANGAEDAFEDLAKAAAEDILIHADVDDLEAAKETVSDLVDYINGAEFDTLEIGDMINFDDAQFQGLRDMINQLAIDTGWTAEQMAAYLNNIGLNIDPLMFEPINAGLDATAVNAGLTAQQIADNVIGSAEAAGTAMENNLSGSLETELESATSQHEDQVVYTNLVPHPGPTTTITSTFPVGSSNPTAAGGGKIVTQSATATVRGVTYTATPVTASQLKQSTGFGLKSKYTKGKGGSGGVKLSDKATASKGSRGGAGSYKPSVASRPASSGGGGGGKGGGGGGGGGQTYEPKEKDPIKEEVDLYEKVNTQLEDVSKELDSIQKNADRLTGVRGRANLEKMLTLMSKEIKLHQEKLKIQKEEQATLAQQLSSQFGITFDGEGFIDNYAAVLKKLEGNVNSLLAQYATLGDEESEKALDKQVKTAQEALTKFKTLYKRYDELRGSEMQETLNSIQSIEDEMEDLRIEVYRTHQEAIDNLRDLNETAAELEGYFSGIKKESPFRDIIEDAKELQGVMQLDSDAVDAYYDKLIAGAQESLAKATSDTERLAAQTFLNYWTEQRKKVLDDMSSGQGLGGGLLDLAYQDLQQLLYWQNNWNDASNPFGDNKAGFDEALQDAFERVTEMILDYEEKVLDLEEHIADGYEDIADRFERHIDQYDRLIDRLETVEDLTTLLYGDDSYEALEQLAQQRGDIYVQRGKEWQQELTRLKDIWDNLSEEDRVGKIGEEIREQIEDAEEEVLESTQNAADAFTEAYTNGVEKVLAGMNRNLLGDSDVDLISNAWERAKRNADQFLDDVERAYEIDKLRAKYMDMLDNTSDLNIQRQIRDAMNEQLGLLEAKDKLSQYDVNYANARLEILQKQIALEDAQRNKNAMQLRRDTQGNYRYVYRANEDDVRGAQQELFDEEFNAYEMSKENYTAQFDNWLNAIQSATEQARQIAERYKDDEKKMNEELDKLRADTLEYLAGVNQEWASSQSGMIESVIWLAADSSGIVQDTYNAASAAMQENWNEAMQSIGVATNDTMLEIGSDMDQVTADVTDAFSSLKAEAQEWLDQMQDPSQGVAAIAGDQFGSAEAAIRNTKDTMHELVNESRDLMNVIAGDDSRLFEAAGQLEKYRGELEKTKNSASVLRQSLIDAQNAREQAERERDVWQTVAQEWQSGKRTQSNPDGTSGGDWNGQITDDLIEGIAGEIWTFGTWGNDPDRYNRLIEKFGETAGEEIYRRVQGMFNSGYGYDQNQQPYRWGDGGYEAYRGYGYASFDTGGYTGSWNDETKGGKLALLHQKELVLNAQDTQNILSAVNMVRDFTTSLQNQAFRVDDLFSGKLGTAMNDTIEQRVEITAEFPNATDQNDIQEALLGLADQAFQYARRER